MKGKDMRSAARWMVGVAICSILSTHTALAQQATPGATAPAPAKAPTAAPDDTIGDIVVTAQRREERLQDVPIAVTALTGANLAQSGITNTQQLTQAIPNLVMTSAGSTYQAVIRGVGTRGVTQGDEANVAIYVDGVYQPDQSGSNFEFLGIQRVEVLRGPQGTLFGRNATGGLINIVTVDPSFKPTAQIELSYGRFNEVIGKGYVSTGLGKHFALDIAALYRRDDGYVYNIFRNVKENPRDSRAIRSKLLFQPDSPLRVVLMGSYSYSNDATPVAYSPLDGNFSAKATFPGILIPGPYQVSTNQPTFNKKWIATGSLQGSYEFSGVTLNSITSYQDSKAAYFNDNDGSQIAISYLNLKSEVQSATQEFRLSSHPGSAFQWVTGVFGFYSTAGYRPLIFCCTTTTGTGIPRAELRTHETVKSIAFFADGTYNLTDHLSLTGGVRVSYESRRHEFTQILLTTGAVQGTGDYHASFHDVSPRASIRYKFNNDAMIYFTYSRGFKSGVFNASSITQPNPVNPEKINAFEFGLKADPLPWLRTNLSVFYYKYDDIQQSARDSTTNAVLLLNAADSTIKGAEFELTAKASHDLDFRFTGTYLDAKYDRFPGAVINTPLPAGGNAQTIVDLFGTDMIRAPHTTFNIAADYHHEFGDGSMFGGSANLYHSAKYYWDFQNRLTVPAYTKVNAEIFYTLPGWHTRLSVWGHNLTNAAVAQNLLPSTTIDDVTYEPPVTYGIAIKQSF
jgi:iron complex outermembrane receptor protein